MTDKTRNRRRPAVKTNVSGRVVLQHRDYVCSIDLQNDNSDWHQIRPKVSGLCQYGVCPESRLSLSLCLCLCRSIDVCYYSASNAWNTDYCDRWSRCLSVCLGDEGTGRDFRDRPNRQPAPVDTTSFHHRLIVCLSRSVAVEKRLNGLTSCLGPKEHLSRRRFWCPHDGRFDAAFAKLIWPFVVCLYELLVASVFFNRQALLDKPAGGWVGVCFVSYAGQELWTGYCLDWQ